MFAIVETGGKQYRVQEGDVITVEKLNVEAGEKIVFDKVLMLSDGETVKVGAPYVESCNVTGTVVENGKGPKVIIFKYKAKKDYRKKQGHRQPYTMIICRPRCAESRRPRSARQIVVILLSDVSLPIVRVRRSAAGVRWDG